MHTHTYACTHTRTHTHTHTHTHAHAHTHTHAHAHTHTHISEYIVQLLELHSCRLQWEVGFVHHTLQEVGVSLTTLFPIYDRMFKSKVTSAAILVD